MLGDTEMTLWVGTAQLLCPQPPAAPCHCQGQGHTAPRSTELPPSQPQPALPWGWCLARAHACSGFKLGPSQAAPGMAQPTPHRVRCPGAWRLLSVPNLSSIATTDSPLGGIRHFWPETCPSLPAKGSEAGRWRVGSGVRIQPRSRNSSTVLLKSPSLWAGAQLQHQRGQVLASCLPAHWRQRDSDAPDASCILRRLITKARAALSGEGAGKRHPHSNCPSPSCKQGLGGPLLRSKPK